MATINQGVMGGFHGRVGTVVGYNWRGKWVMRARPAFIRNPRTEAQQRHRMMFREEVRLASRLNWLLRESMEQLSLDEGLTPCNYFIKENQHCFSWDSTVGTQRAVSAVDDTNSLADTARRVPTDGGGLLVDWANLVLSHGPVAPVAFGVPEVSEGTRLTIGFEKNPEHRRADALDKVHLFLYCTDCEECFLAAPVYRADRQVSVVLPAWWEGKEVQLWGLVEDQQGRWSETIYIGYGELTSLTGLTPDSSPCGEGIGMSVGTERALSAVDDTNSLADTARRVPTASESPGHIST